MLKGYTAPRTPKGTSSLAPMPPWHYVGTCLAVEYEADPKAVASFLPPGLDFHSPRCAVYFVDWQYASESGEEYLDPVRSQYRETIFLASASYEGTPCAYCPFIWVDQDVALMRGFAQGWPKQIGSTWITRAYDLPSKAAPVSGRAENSAPRSQSKTVASLKRSLRSGSRPPKCLPRVSQGQSTSAISLSLSRGGMILRLSMNWCSSSPAM